MGTRATLRTLSWSISLTVVVSTGALAAIGTAGSPTFVPAQEQRKTIADALEQLPLSFIENRGQLDPSVDYYVQGSESSLFFTPRGLTLALGPEEGRWALQHRFLGARATEPLAQERTPGVVSYFTGSPEEWETGIPTFSEVAYRDLWPGIDLVYSGNASRLKYDLVVRPGVDPSEIRVAYRGATSLELTSAGDLRVATPLRDFWEQAPYAYQEIGGERIQVPASFDLGPDRSYGFDLGSYDRSRSLVIDPAMVVYAGYIGGSGREVGQGVAVDAEGNAYVTGLTDSSEATFPATVGPDTTFNGGPEDAFVVKVNSAGTGLVYAGYIGGAGDDNARDIAVDAEGNAYVTGLTDSSEATFPATVGPDTTFNGGLDDAFVAKVNPTGTGLLYAGYVGGSGSDQGLGIALDAGGNAYVSGPTNSTEATFPVGIGPDETYNGGSTDAFVAKVNPTGTGLLYAGYIGGASQDYGEGLAVDSLGSAYLTGLTASSEATFPATVGPDTTFSGVPGASDIGFVAKVNPTGTGLLYAGYIEGAWDDYVQGIDIAVDSEMSAYVVGVTNASEGEFPVAVGPDTTYNGDDDAFLVKVNPAGTSLTYAGYIGGSADDLALGVAVDAEGSAYVTGVTDSSEATFPVADGPDSTHNGGADAFLAKVNPAGTALVYAGYIGGAASDGGDGIAIDAVGNAYVTGVTFSTEATFPATVGPDTTYNGGLLDAFVAKVSEGIAPAGADLSLTKADSPDPVQVKKVLTYTLTVTNGGPDHATAVTVEDQLPAGVQFGSATASQGTCTQAGGVVTCSLGSLANGASATVTIKVRPTGTGTLTNTAEVVAAEPDPNPGNNSDTETTEVTQSGGVKPPPSCTVKPCP
jgi:uncharacterized repeat protein (TIGR01451 family)